MSFGAGSSSSKTTETQLSRQQAEILKEREAQYQEYFFPQLIGAFKELEQGGMSPQVAKATEQAGSAFQGAQNAFEKAIARRGLYASGVESRGLAQLGAARASALSNIYQQAEGDRFARRNQLLQMGGSLSPTPTTAAPMGQNSSRFNAKVGIPL